MGREHNVLLLLLLLPSMLVLLLLKLASHSQDRIQLRPKAF